MKIQGRLDETEDQFMLFLNGYSIYEYDRYIEKTQDEADGDGKKKYEQDIRYNLQDRLERRN